MSIGSAVLVCYAPLSLGRVMFVEVRHGELWHCSHVMAKLVKICLGAMWQSRCCMARRSEVSFVEPVEACYAEVMSVAVRSC